MNIATGETQDERDPSAVALGRKGGLKGGRARAESLTAERRSEIAKAAAAARWSKEGESEYLMPERSSV